MDQKQYTNVHGRCKDLECHKVRQAVGVYRMISIVWPSGF